MATLIKSLPVAGEAVFEFASETEARGTFACDAKSVLRTLEKWHCISAIVRIPNQPDIIVPIATLRMMAEFTAIVQLFFADTSLPATILKTAAAKLEEDSSRWGIVRMSDERQVVMSSGMSGVLLSGVAINETTNWRRPEFWEPSDLRSFNEEWRQQLDDTGSRLMEWRYRIHKPNTNDSWDWYRSSYRLLKGEDGILYQVCSFIDRG